MGWPPERPSQGHADTGTCEATRPTDMEPQGHRRGSWAAEMQTGGWVGLSGVGPGQFPPAPALRTCWSGTGQLVTSPESQTAGPGAGVAGDRWPMCSGGVWLGA